MAEPKILIIDDDDLSSELVSRALRKTAPHLRVVAAEDGQAGIEALSGVSDEPCERPLLILLDLNMPRMNGFEFLEEMRGDPALRKNVVFIFSTSEDEEDRDRAYDYDVAGYIPKSKVGPQLSNMTALLQSYTQTVTLPA